MPVCLAGLSNSRAANETSYATRNTFPMDKPFAEHCAITMSDCQCSLIRSKCLVNTPFPRERFCSFHTFPGQALAERTVGADVEHGFAQRVGVGGGDHKA